MTTAMTTAMATGKRKDQSKSLFKAPFPYFGGKSRIANIVWRHFGDVRNYVEPFFGSGAVLLGRPGWDAESDQNWTETTNDYDGLLGNFWRALQKDPKGVAKWADWPVIENDLHARHMWLVERKDTLQGRLEGDPGYCDVKAAGWWVWGMACWIGREFCSGNGPWQIVEKDSSRQLVRLSGKGHGVSHRRIHLGNTVRGVNRQLVHLGDRGRGVNRQRVHLTSKGCGVSRRRVHLADSGQGDVGLIAWMESLAQRLRRVRVCCGDWRRVCGGKSGDALGHFFAGGDTCAIFLDPPYANTAGRDPNIYRLDSGLVAHAVRNG
jgi:hypothetical protein